MSNRPAGISILALIYILISSIGLISSISLPAVNWLAILSMLGLGISAVAFYMGQKWAWWIIATLTLISIIINVPQFYYIVTNSDLIPDIRKYYLKHGGKIVVQTLILLFMFSKPIIKFFSFKTLNRAKLSAILIAAVVVLFFVLKLFSYLMLATHR